MDWLTAKTPAKIIVEELEASCAPGGIVELLSAQVEPAILESSALDETWGRYSIFACCPLDVLTLREGVLQNRDGKVLANGSKEIWAALARGFKAFDCDTASGRLPYAPGWIGYVGYEVGRHIERLPGQAVVDTALPDLRLAFYDSLLVHDNLKEKWTLVRLAADVPAIANSQTAEILRSILQKHNADSTSSTDTPIRCQQVDASVGRSCEDAKPNFTPDAYRDAVQRCVDYIAAGDIFQVNLSQRFSIDNAPAPASIYRALRKRNPAWYSAYLAFNEGQTPCAVVSSSPELFLRLRDGKVVTRPIKGTRRRIGDPKADALAQSDLLSNPKDNAELAMIVDLLRNDLGRVCDYRTVRVVDPARLETHPTVFHLTATVEGTLAPGVGPAQLLRATFPGGSITGAPKIRAMEIIDQLEPCGRGVYTGCIGHVGVNGGCEWNIVIRTVICSGDKAYVQVGGGIVADSTPDGEYNETLDKARAILEAIENARSFAADTV